MAGSAFPSIFDGVLDRLDRRADLADWQSRLGSRLDELTLGWVHWFDHVRLYSHCRDVPPAEFEAAFYAAQQADPAGAGIQ